MEVVVKEEDKINLCDVKKEGIYPRRHEGNKTESSLLSDTRFHKLKHHSNISYFSFHTQNNFHVEVAQHGLNVERKRKRETAKEIKEKQIPILDFTPLQPTSATTTTTNAGTFGLISSLDFNLFLLFNMFHGKIWPTRNNTKENKNEKIQECFA